MARRRNELETGERAQSSAEASKPRIIPQLRDTRDLKWEDYPELKTQVWEIWSAYLAAKSRPWDTMAKSDVTDAFKDALSRVVEFKRLLANGKFIEANQEKRRKLRAAVIPVLIDAGISLENLDASIQAAEDSLHQLDMALGEVCATIETAESTSRTDRELRDEARLRIRDALSGQGLPTLIGIKSLWVEILLQLENREAAGSYEDRERRNLRDDLKKLVKSANAGNIF